MEFLRRSQSSIVNKHKDKGIEQCGLTPSLTSPLEGEGRVEGQLVVFNRLKLGGYLSVRLLHQYLAAPVRVVGFRKIFPVIVRDETALFSKKGCMGHDLS